MDVSPRVLNQLAVTLLLTAVIAATYGFGVYLFPVVLPQMKHDIGFNYAQAGYITAARQLANIAMALLSGLAAALFRGSKDRACGDCAVGHRPREPRIRQ